MNIKAQGLLNAAKWIEEEHGQSALRDIIRACSAPVRERYTSAIAINWHPVEEFVELVAEADRQLGGGHYKIAEQIGAAGARGNIKGVLLRLVFYLAKPDFLMQRLANLWRQFNDEGAMELLFVEPQSLQVELRGIPEPNEVFCAVITGWGREVAAIGGAASAVCRHISCRTRGQPRCIWEIRYNALLDETGKGEGLTESARTLAARPPASARGAAADSVSRLSARPPSSRPPPMSGTSESRSSARPPSSGMRIDATPDLSPRPSARPPKAKG